MTVNTMGSVFLALHKARVAQERRQTDAKERAYLRSLKWTEEQSAAFDERVADIHWRADRVLGLELCQHGVTYKACRSGCPPWPWPKLELPEPTVTLPHDTFEGPFGSVLSGTCAKCHRASHVLSQKQGVCPECFRSTGDGDA